jgi:hypothetical protein
MISRFKQLVMAVSLAGMSMVGIARADSSGFVGGLVLGASIPIAVQKMFFPNNKPVVAFDLRHGVLTTEKPTLYKVLNYVTDKANGAEVETTVSATAHDSAQRKLCVSAALKTISSTEFFDRAKAVKDKALYTLGMNIANHTFKPNEEMVNAAEYLKKAGYPVRIVSSMTKEQVPHLMSKPGFEKLAGVFAKDQDKNQFMEKGLATEYGSLARANDPEFFKSFIAKNKLANGKFTLVTNSDNVCQAAQKAGQETKTDVTCQTVAQMYLTSARANGQK